MDSFQTALTTFILLAVIFLMVAFVCHYLGPRASAWFRSNREEKIGLSKSKIFNANGYMIHSGSELLQFSSTGSFKRFDSIDRDYKQTNQTQTSLTTTVMPSWNIAQNDIIIPPQPLRPAPAPTLLPNNKTTLSSSHVIKNSTGFHNSNDLPTDGVVPMSTTEIGMRFGEQQTQICSQIIEKPIREKINEIDQKILLTNPSTSTTVIPRPITKRKLINQNGSIQMWNGEKLDNPKEFRIVSHYNGTINNEIPFKINLSDAVSKIQKNFSTSLTSVVSFASSSNLNNQEAQPPQQQQPHQTQQHKRNPSTNPFLNNTQDIPLYSNNFDNPLNDITNNSKNIINNNNSINYYLTKRNSTNSLPITSPKLSFKYNRKNISVNSDYNGDSRGSDNDNVQIFYKNEIENKNPFTSDCVRLVQQQFNTENHKNFNYNQQQQQTRNFDHSNDIFDLLPEMKEPPKTDIDRYSFFDFEPERITSILNKQTKHKTPPSSATTPLTATALENDQYNIKSSSSTSIMPMENLSSPSSLSSQENAIGSTTVVHDNGNQTDNENLISKNVMQQRKYLDSPCSDVFDDIETMLKKHFRNRSFSETEATDTDLRIFKRNSINTKSLNTNPFLEKGFTTMHKTFSENFLAKSYSNNYLNQTWSFGRSLSRQDSGMSLGRRNSSQGSLNSDNNSGSERFNCSGSLDSINLQRAISCESVSSQSSVVLADLEPVVPPVTGQLCVGVQYDKSTLTEAGIDLVVTVMEAKELIGPSNLESFDTFVRIYLVPDETGAMQTKLFKNSKSPSFNETFCFWLNKKRGRRSLWFHLYHSGSTHTLIGEAEMQISDVTATRPLTTWLSLLDSRQNNAKWGELMFSLSYLPTAERLTVVVVKGRNLKLEKNGKEILIESQNIFVKVYLLKDNRKVSKKKTSLKRKDRCPIFNESMIFSIPPYLLNSIQVRLTVMSVSDTESLPIGHIIVGSNTNGKGIRHWNQMLTSLRKPIAMWHPLRKTAKFTDVT